MDISRCVLTIFAGRTRQANVAFHTILTVDTLDGDTIFAIFTFDGNAILAINADAGLAISPIDTHMAILSIFTVFASTTDVQVIAELQIINLLPIVACLLSNLEVAFRIRIFCCWCNCTAIDGNFRMMLIDVFNLIVHLGEFRIDVRLYLMKLVFRSSTAADIRTIILPGLVVQVSDILASLISAGSIAILIINGQAVVTSFDVANLDTIVAASNNLPLRAIDSDLVVTCAGRNSTIGATNGNFLIAISGIAKGNILGQIDGVFFTANRIRTFCDSDILRTSFYRRILTSQSLDRFQLSYVDSIRISEACNYPSNLASNPFCVITVTDITHRYGPIR